MKYFPPGPPGSIVSAEPRYENFIGGKWPAPTHGKYRVDLAPATTGPITEAATPRRRTSNARWTLPRGEGRLG
jgi:aldehyde dehydrogenase